ncbi:molybdenum ABC transporter ATP-binding protein [Methyloprofundus sedimenti]|uniref:Molybdenum ABC transporter ATP-binding protein n=1 Tax=Methyloprofundus sedimenti TaxID=1420851 RepID=A0A1V8M1U2_9GAMM|nr:molybdenum ABC transporter ATP-binding protein [Methyloprofundus sedimenti]OQK15478.1 molybdenum ABC transporter ATP-binding protein [Methyloprofundus sedimenti]
MSTENISACFKLDFNKFSLDVDLTLPSHGVSALFGHSGSGKTTLLRCIAGLERAAGHLCINGEVWQNNGLFIPTHKRPLGYVFQEASLFPHLSVLGNLKYGMQRVSGANSTSSLEHSIELLGIGHLLERKPARLSGGERQRVAIARALAVNPRILLMDEPLAALDMARKKEILPFLERLRDQLKIPIVYVTHSADEMARLADHLVVMTEGKAIASGSLTETLSRLDLPIQLNEESGVVLKAFIAERDQQWHLARAEFPGGSLWMRDMGFAIGRSVRLRVLARDVSLTLELEQTESQTKSSIVNVLPAVINELVTGEHPAITLARIQVGESILLCRLTSRSAHALDLSVGKSVSAQIKSAAIID